MHEITGVISNRNTIRGTDGRPDRVKISLGMFGKTLSFWVPERFVHDAIEGTEVKVVFDLVPGKWNEPLVKTISVGKVGQ